MKLNHFTLRRDILIFLMYFISSSLVAQKINVDSLNIDQLNLYKDRAVKMRNAGMILTFSGAGIVVTGIIIANIPNDRYPDYTGDPSHDGISIWAIAFAELVGIATTVTGIPLWAVGGSRKAKAELSLQKFNIAPQGSMALGVGITLRF